MRTGACAPGYRACWVRLAAGAKCWLFPSGSCEGGKESGSASINCNVGLSNPGPERSPMRSLILRSIAGLLFLIAMLGLALFGSAGTLSYWRAWLYLAVFGGCVML